MAHWLFGFDGGNRGNPDLRLLGIAEAAPGPRRTVRDSGTLLVFQRSSLACDRDVGCSDCAGSSGLYPRGHHARRSSPDAECIRHALHVFVVRHIWSGICFILAAFRQRRRKPPGETVVATGYGAVAQRWKREPSPGGRGPTHQQLLGWLTAPGFAASRLVKGDLWLVLFDVV